MNLEQWNRWLSWATVVLPLLAVAASAGVIYTRGKLAQRSNAQTVALKNAIAYAGVAKFNAVGLYDMVVGPGLEEHSAINDQIGRYVQRIPFKWDCTPPAMAAYDAAIGIEGKFPYAHMYKGLCKRAQKVDGWMDDIGSARQIFAITVSIPGHHRNHEEAQTVMENLLRTP